jgi:translocator protein
MNDSFTWYQLLAKPSWAPPSWLFGPVWSVLYVVIAVSFGAVFFKTANRQLAFLVALPFVLNLIFNFAFTPLQFGLRNNLLAGVDILLVLATLIWALLAIYPHLRWVAWVNLPYLVWVGFASVLQLTILFLNWRK